MKVAMIAIGILTGLCIISLFIFSIILTARRVKEEKF
jgi:uncharacterized membrane protein YhaH (DUF805 family)